MTRGRGGVRIPPKNDDVIYEQPLKLWIWRGFKIGELLDAKEKMFSIRLIFRFIMTDSATGVAEGSISKNEQKRQLKVFIIIIFVIVFFAATQSEKLCLRDVFGYIFFWLNLPSPQFDYWFGFGLNLIE